MRTDRPANWSRAQRRLHWWIAALVFAGFALGWVMVAVPLRQLLLKFALYQLHKTIGLTVFGLTAIRFFTRLRRGRPGWDAVLPRWQRHAAETMHVLLYGLLFVVPMLGYLTAAASVTEVPTLFLGVIPIPHIVASDAALSAIVTPVHRVLAVALVLLACGHALAAVRHHVLGSDALRRMWRG